MENVWKDLRHSLRALRRSPAFAAAAIASLALGIGANTLIFTFLNALFLKSLPVAEPERAVALYSVDLVKGDVLPFSYPNFEDLRREEGQVFSGMAAYRDLSAALRGDGEPAQLQGEIVSASYFDVLGVKPAHGRFFRPDEDAPPGAHPVVVLSHRLWQSRFGGDPGVVNRQVSLNGQGFTVVGIARPELRGLSLLDAPPDFWVPISMHAELVRGPRARMLERRGAFAFSVVARLKPGVGLEETRAFLQTVAGRLEREFPQVNQDLGLEAVPLTQATLPPQVRGRVVLSGGLLAAAVGLLLLIAGANVANLLLTRAAARSGEVAVRLSLGAARGRLLQQLLTEGAVLGLLGGGAGLLIALVGRTLLWKLRPPFFPDTLDFGMDARVLGFTLFVSLLTGLLFSLAPALQSFKLNLSAVLTRQARGSGARGDGSGSFLRESLVVAQVALSVVVLAGAALFLRSLAEVERVDPGFETRKLFVIPLDLGTGGYPPPRAVELYRRAVERVAAVPGVESAATASSFLLAGGGPRASVFSEAQATRPNAAPEGERQGGDVMATVTTVGLGYFDTVGMRLRSGRAFTLADRRGGRPVVMVNESLARRLWPGEPAVGKRLRISLGEEAGWLEVVGVVADAHSAGLSAPPPPSAWRPLLQSFSPMMMLHVRTAGDPEPLLETVRREVQALDPGLPILEPRTITQVRDQSLWAPRIGAGLLSLFGLLALSLAAIGIYGVIAYAIGQRRREIGIRMALGAARREVLRMVLRQGMRPVVIGLVIGLICAFAGARAIASLLFGIGAGDPLSFAGAALLLGLVALAAVYLPARRASGVDPIRALRES